MQTLKIKEITHLLICENPSCTASFEVKMPVLASEIVAFIESGELLPCGHKPAYFLDAAHMIKRVRQLSEGV